MSDTVLMGFLLTEVVSDILPFELSLRPRLFDGREPIPIVSLPHHYGSYISDSFLYSRSPAELTVCS